MCAGLFWRCRAHARALAIGSAIPIAVSDRREAINRAVAAALVDDVVIIAGKGHETYQIIGNEKFHFDDREVALEAIKRHDEGHN